MLRTNRSDKSFQSVETAKISRLVQNPDVLLRVPAVTCPRTYDRLIEFTKAIMPPESAHPRSPRSIFLFARASR